MNNEINIIDFAKLLIRKWWIILLCAVVACLASYIYTKYFIQPVYTSRGLLYVNNTNSGYNIITVNPNNAQNKNVSLNDIYASQRLAMTNIEILKSDTFMEIINRKAGLNFSPGKLRSLISVSAVNETEILQIQVSNPDKYLAATIVQAILDNANDEITRVINGGSAEIIDNANIPVRPSSPNAQKNLLIGTLLGMVLGIIIIYLTDLLDDHVKGQEDLSRRYDLPVLGIIPSLRSKRRSGYSYSYESAIGKPPVNSN